MKIDLFAICYNEEIMLPYFLKHYSKFCDNITIYDNMSTDSSREIMKKYGVNIKTYDSNNQIRDDLYLEIKNNCWKKSDADWVIVCDADEFLYNKTFLKNLDKTKGTIIRPEGCQMVSEKLPVGDGQIYDEIKTGFLDSTYSKPCLFKPKEIKECNFGPGAHSMHGAKGNIIYDEESGIKLLHYHFISREYVINRHTIFGKRLSQKNWRKGWGLKYAKPAEWHGIEFDKKIKKSFKILD